MSKKHNIFVGFHLNFFTINEKNKLDMQVEKLIDNIDELLLSKDERSNGGTTFSDILILAKNENKDKVYSYFGILYIETKGNKRSLIYSALKHLYPNSNISIAKVPFKNGAITPKDDKELYFTIPIRFNQADCILVLATNNEKYYHLTAEQLSEGASLNICLKDMVTDHILIPFN